MESEESCCCEDNGKNTCCQSEVLDLPSVEENEVPTSSHFQFSKALVGTIDLPSDLLVEKIEIEQFDLALLDLPPPKTREAYLLFCRLTYYG